MKCIYVHMHARTYACTHSLTLDRVWSIVSHAARRRLPHLTSRSCERGTLYDLVRVVRFILARDNRRYAKPELRNAVVIAVWRTDKWMNETQSKRCIAMRGGGAIMRSQRKDVIGIRLGPGANKITRGIARGESRECFNQALRNTVTITKMSKFTKHYTCKLLCNLNYKFKYNVLIFNILFILMR